MFMKLLSRLGNRVWQGVCRGDRSDLCSSRSRGIHYCFADPSELPEHRPGHIGYKRYFAAVVNRVSLLRHMHHVRTFLHFVLENNCDWFIEMHKTGNNCTVHGWYVRLIDSYSGFFPVAGVSCSMRT